MMHTGKSLTVKDNDMQEGTEIVQSDYQGLDSQKWQIRDSGKSGWIISPLSNLQLSTIVSYHNGYGEAFKKEVTLKEAIIDFLDGCLSDGIGENPIGKVVYNHTTHDVWLGKLIEI